MGDKEKWKFIMKRDGTRGVAFCERSALLRRAVKLQPVVPLKSVSGSVAVEEQESVSMSLTHITTREYGDVPGWGSH